MLNEYLERIQEWPWSKKPKSKSPSIKKVKLPAPTFYHKETL